VIWVVGSWNRSWTATSATFAATKFNMIVVITSFASA
jgi:hypothetical protein